ncbi:MAG TPA: YtxH domain-containing protein [Vicinamibacteria bacterium]
MAKDTVQLDQGKLMDRLERLEKQIAKSGEQRGGGFGTALKAFTVGALVGGGAALLYAPQRGEQTRQRLLQAKEQATQMAGQAKEQTAQLAGQAQQAAGQLKDQAQQAAGQTKDQVQSSTAKSPSAATPPAGQAMAQQRRDLASGRENPA